MLKIIRIYLANKMLRPGRGIKHDDVHEELAPTTYCKTNKKTHSHSPPLSKLVAGFHP